MDYWFGLQVLVMSDVPSVLRHGPRSIVVTPQEYYGLASMDKDVMSAILTERQSYELARAAA